MCCISFVTYSIIINGSLYGYIHLTRGLRQGDPLSLYLFLFCVEGLLTLIAKRESKGRLKGISICCGAPPVTHLLFVDDCLLFTKATPEDCGLILSILCTYEMALGQVVNLCWWGWLVLIDIRSISACPLLLVETEVSASLILRSSFGRDFKVGMGSFLVLRVGSSLSKLLPNLSHYTSWAVSSYPGISAMTLISW